MAADGGAAIAVRKGAAAAFASFGSIMPVVRHSSRSMLSYKVGSMHRFYPVLLVELHSSEGSKHYKHK